MATFVPLQITGRHLRQIIKLVIFLGQMAEHAEAYV